MNKIEVIFKGEDVVLKSELLEAIGLKKGEKVEVRPSKLDLVPASFSEEEKARRAKVIRETYGAWTEEEGESAMRDIREMREKWQPRNLS
ncbi:MAG: hypothetical protein MAG431_01771 [Chloroflexi bacterium]|nr:hypothetical protein [Chloroflexota bacterium]